MLSLHQVDGKETMMKSKNKSRYYPVLGNPEDIIPKEDTCVSNSSLSTTRLCVKDWMDAEFGPGKWVWDERCDTFIALDAD